MSAKGWPSFGGGDSQGKDSPRPLPPDVVKTGYLKKFKTMKKKFFVLRGDSMEAAAKLEYYDSEKKFRSNLPAKRSVTLKNCFNINRRSDTRQKHVIALYTKNDCFCIVLETEEELEEWLKALLSLQQGEDIPDGELPKPTFEHVWPVNVQKKELGSKKNILGPYHLCLTDRTLTLVKKGTNQQLEFSLQKIRRCGHLESFFYMEVGQATVTGEGNLWMQTEDPNIAQNMHAAILNAMTNCSKKGDLVPKSRNRSSSANEASKPITVIQRWPTHAVGVTEGSLPCHKEASSVATSPASVSDSSHSVVLVPMASVQHRAVIELHTTQRRHSVSALNPGGGTQSFPLSPNLPSRRASTGTRPICKKSTTSHSLTGVRDRCDSLPSRARTTSEGAHHVPHHMPSSRHLAPVHSHSSRPHSMYIRGISYSPPVGSSPVSPSSGAYSTDSAGSSLSMDGDGGEGGWCMEGESRYGHSLTPDEPVIMEENLDDYAPWQGEDEKLNNYMSMDPSMSLHIHSNTSLASLRKYSPNPTGFKSSSPSQGSFIDVYSPCGSSPLETPGAYMPMSPGDTRAAYNRAGSTNHSRGSSLAEEGYVPMGPKDDGYVDMDHGQSSSRRGEASSGSSCSITSGTPSTDIRFSEYNLERVSTLISQDDVTPNERPTRAYSVGSRPVNINNNTNRCDAVVQSEPHRVRAFSVGSRAPKARPVLHPHLATPTHHSSHSSVEPSEDLMELDFTKNSKKRTRNKNIFKKPATSVSSERLTLPSGSGVSSAASSYSTAEGSYMESPRSSPKPADLEVDVTHLAPSPPKNNRFSSIIGRSPPKSGYSFERKLGYLSSSPPISHSSPPLYRVPEADSGYVEMTTGSKGKVLTEETMINNLSSSPSTVTRPKSPINNDEYMEMKPGNGTKAVLPKSSQPRVETFPVNEPRTPFVKMNTTPTIKQPLLTSHNVLRSKGSFQDDYLDMSLKRKISLVEDNNNTKVVVGRTAPVDTPKKAPEGYVEMSWSKPQRKVSVDSIKSENEDYLNMSGGSLNKRERRGSRKDHNRYTSQPIAIQPSNKDVQTTSVIFPFCGRKHSTGTPPKIPCFLPLNSCSSSSPSSSPFSSLGRNRGRKMARRDSKDSNTGSGMTTPSGSTTTIFPLNLNSPGSPMKPITAKQEYNLSMCPVDASSGTVRLSQPEQQSSSSNLSSVDTSDYVNFAPGGNQEPSDLGYALIKPDVSVPEPSEVDTTKTPSLERIVVDMSKMSLTDVAVDTNAVSEVSTRLSDLNTTDSQSDAGAAAGGSTRNGGADPAAVSRTSSVCSVGEKELHYASLDLVRSSSEDDTGQTRSLKSQTSLTESSSTSTPSPNMSTDPSFTYAEIDFVASQKLLRH